MKQRLIRQLGLGALVLGCALTGLLVHQTSFARHGFAADPSVVVHIDLDRILNDLDEAAAIAAKLSAVAREIQDHQTRQSEEIEALKAEAETLTGEARHARLSQAMVAGAQLEGWVAARTRLYNNQRRDRYYDIYNKVIEAAGELAEVNGYDYVLLSDERLAPDPGARLEEMVPQMFARQMIYANPGRDVSSELIERMNNAYAASN